MVAIAPDTLLHQRYRILRQIGQGGMGAVYEATDERLGHRVAVKQTLANGDEMNQAFEREARLLASLRHPGLAVVSDFFHDLDNLFLVMQYIPGDDLASLLEKRGKPFELKEILGWADELLAVISYLHNHQPPIIHRDIKPQNMKVTTEGSIVLLDFGLSKKSTGQDNATMMGLSIFGYSPSYAPPEQIQGAGTDQRSDIFSLGATFYHLLTGALPADATSRAAAVFSRQPDPLKPAHDVNPAVPVAVSEVLSHAMAPVPEDRIQTAQALREALHAAAAAPQTNGKAANSAVSGAAPTVIDKPGTPGGAAPTVIDKPGSAPTVMDRAARANAPTVANKPQTGGKTIRLPESEIPESVKKAAASSTKVAAATAQTIVAQPAAIKASVGKLASSRSQRLKYLAAGTVFALIGIAVLIWKPRVYLAYLPLLLLGAGAIGLAIRNSPNRKATAAWYGASLLLMVALVGGGTGYYRYQQQGILTIPLINKSFVASQPVSPTPYTVYDYGSIYFYATPEREAKALGLLTAGNQVTVDGLVKKDGYVWFHFSDPATKQVGWVEDNYLKPVEKQ